LQVSGSRTRRSWRSFGVGGFDPLTYAAVPAGLALVAIVASWIPARHASHVNAIASLRGE
jgi:hypothetical protein